MICIIIIILLPSGYLTVRHGNLYIHEISHEIPIIFLCCFFLPMISHLKKSKTNVKNMDVNCEIPGLVNIQKAMENDHRNSGFTQL